MTTPHPAPEHAHQCARLLCQRETTGDLCPPCARFAVYAEVGLATLVAANLLYVAVAAWTTGAPAVAAGAGILATTLTAIALPIVRRTRARTIHLTTANDEGHA